MGKTVMLETPVASLTEMYQIRHGLNVGGLKHGLDKGYGGYSQVLIVRFLNPRAGTHVQVLTKLYMDKLES